jgi:hypothetical protein
LRYPLAGLLMVAVCAVIAGAASVSAIADWLHDLDDIARARLGFGRGVPATTTMWRLLTVRRTDSAARVQPRQKAAPQRHLPQRRQRDRAGQTQRGPLGGAAATAAAS